MTEVSKSKYKRIFSVLFQLTKKVNESAPLNDLLRSVAQAATELVEANSCSIMLLDELRCELLSKASFGLTPEEEERITFRIGEGVAGWVVERGAPALIADVFVDPRFVAVDTQVTHIRSMLAVPLSSKEGVIGVICATSSQPAAFGKDHEDLLAYLGASVVKDIENARLFRLSITDSLTKAYNRQYLYQRLPEEMDRSRRYGDDLSLALLDIDLFKRVNDTYGHPAGDFVLKEVVRLTRQQVRDVDALVRYGGEEFLVLLPNTPVDGALVFAERIRQAIGQAELRWSDQKLKITVSVGVAEFTPDVATDELFLKRADEALYRAKQQGRNRVVSYLPTE